MGHVCYNVSVDHLHKAKGKTLEKETEQQNTIEINEAKENVPAEDEGLTPEKIAHLLSVLGDDIINDMLESAGLSSLSEEEAEDETGDDAEGASDDNSEDTPDEVPAGSEKKPVKKVRRRRRAYTRFLFVIIFALIMMSLYALNQIYMSARLNADDPITYSTNNDDISCTQGVLKVNDVRVSVPTDGKEKYSISYSWAEEDEEYPSVPHAITAIYYDANSNPLYNLTLYRNDTIQPSDIPKGKNAENWFDDWPVEEGDGISQDLLKTDNVSGFYISPEPVPADAEEPPEYTNYSYYFAVKEGKSISIYVLEGEWLSEEEESKLPDIMDACIQSIRTTKDKPQDSKETEETDSEA